MKSSDERRMVRYLLGQLDGTTEKGQVEQQYFEDEDYLERLRIVEDELIESYVRGELSAAQETLFRTNFLASPARLARVERVQALHRVIGSAAKAKAAPVVLDRPRQSLLRELRSVLRPGPIFMTAGALVVLVGAGWFVVRHIGLGRELDRLRAEQGRLRIDRQSAQDAVQRERARSEQLERELQAERERRSRLVQERTMRQPGQVPVLSFMLFPGALRSMKDEEQVLRIPRSVRLIALELDVPPIHRHKRYRASVQTAENLELMSQTVTQFRSSGSHMIIDLELPARLLPRGEYIIKLQGLSGGGRPTQLPSYTFSVTRD